MRKSLIFFVAVSISLSLLPIPVSAISYSEKDKKEIIVKYRDESEFTTSIAINAIKKKYNPQKLERKKIIDGSISKLEILETGADDDVKYIAEGLSKEADVEFAVPNHNSRYIVGWELSDTLDTAPVLAAVKGAISRYGKPGIINSDQGSQFTSDNYTVYLKAENIRQSMDGKARWVDNVIIERWFRSLKTERIYPYEYQTPRALRAGIRGYIEEYNTERPHQTHDYLTPVEVYLGKKAA